MKEIQALAKRKLELRGLNAVCVFAMLIIFRALLNSSNSELYETNRNYPFLFVVEQQKHM